MELLFGIHCHQPVDNFHNVVDEAINKAYKPFFKVISGYKDFKFSVHYSGWLLEYIKYKDEELFEMMKKSADNGQIEFFTSGYYEPVLASIPSDYRKKQIEKLNRFIKENFGQTPTGVWLTERVWSDNIVPDLVEMGIEYVVVDDYHFLSSGFKKENLYGFYNTEVDGYKIKLFPIDKTLRYIIPFKPIDDVINYLSSIKENKAGIIFDDGEKFGIWPNTYWWVYENRWLEDFINAVLSSKNIKTSLFKEYSDNHKPEGIAYLPITSYQEMGEWSCFADDYIEILSLKEIIGEERFEKYVKGNIWKNFFVKYPESNRLHKRMLEVAKYSKNEEAIMKAQCNDVYWHGIFGGLYLPNLRDNAYRYIIQADKENTETKIEDINFDGYEEIKINNEKIITIFDTKGGQLTELSLKDVEFNFQNTLTRRKEGYHQLFFIKKEEKETKGISTIHEIDLSQDIEKLKDLLIYDWYDKNSFIDHIVDNSINLNSFYRCSFKEYSDFTKETFEIKDFSNNKFALYRKGNIYIGDSILPAYIEKNIVVEDSSIKADINFDIKADLLYLVEFNFHFANLQDITIQGREDIFFEDFSKEFKIYDSYTKKEIIFSFDKDMKIFVYPINTITQSEKGIDTINQGLSIGFICNIQNLSLNLKII
ncbi:DUF1926 domain-containing protein [Venenivibrio stagnispumantis]|uniref:Alpha-amylase n=1 Tax=Venenivibrio stagnispumantis TaxID=407998 RepID=A0AA45WMG1_9AQUI|nr:alpha-amylase/4-alpha-glucanotransferase domain-containing protein [Venenivibrio stagnispumantis]MCW4573632.1 DUF1926 domain-containing protein [Venenivibrio stagnispumantis]SMP14262.1 alpha-amylase [Venenivibrio stagnispumantis]